MRKRMKWIICKNCKGAGSRAPLRSICQDCGGRGSVRAEDRPPTKAQLWRRVARLAGEALFLQGANGCPFPMEGTDNAVYEIKFIIDSLRDYHNEKFEKKANRLGGKLEAALAAWEAAK